jgi:hypothetical protein
MSTQTHDNDKIDKTIVVTITLTVLLMIALSSTPEWRPVTGPSPSDVAKLMQALR